MWCWSEVAHAAPGEGRGGGEEAMRDRERGRWNRACSLGLFSHPLMKRTASPRGLLEFLASGRMRDICPSVTPQHTNTHTHTFSFPPWLSVSVTQTYTSTPQPHTLHFDLQANGDKPICQVCWREIKGKKKKCFHSFGHCGHQLWQHYSALLQQSHTGQEKKLSGDQTGYERANRLAKIWKWVNFKFFVIFIALN